MIDGNIEWVHTLTRFRRNLNARITAIVDNCKVDGRRDRREVDTNGRVVGGSRKKLWDVGKRNQFLVAGDIRRVNSNVCDGPGTFIRENELNC